MFDNYYSFTVVLYLYVNLTSKCTACLISLIDYYFEYIGKHVKCFQKHFGVIELGSQNRRNNYWKTSKRKHFDCNFCRNRVENLRKVLFYQKRFGNYRKMLLGKHFVPESKSKRIKGWVQSVRIA